MTRRLGLVLWLALAAGATAQTRPQPVGGDARIQTVAYSADQVVTLSVAPGFQLSLEFAPDERIENVALGDSGAWTATPNRRGDHLFVKSTPGAGSTNMTVITDAHSYEFELVGGGVGDPTLPYVVRFSYARPATPPALALAPAAGRYKLSGASALRPRAIDDDGAKTAIVWPADRPMPAVYAINEGAETLVSGAVRDGRYVIDGVANELVFRLDAKEARARRVPRLATR